MKNQTKIIIAIVAVIAILIIASGSYAAYYFLLRDKGNNNTQQATITEKLGITEKNNIKEPEKITAEQKDEEEVKVEEESQDNSSKSDTTKVDTEKDSDNDGLTDIEEATYKTNPNKIDTDGDGYSDYIEIKSGFDPLTAPEEAKTNTSTTNNSGESTDTETTTNYPDPQQKMYVFFMHHSTGEIYWNGGLNQALTDHNYEGYAPWWDGETDPDDFYNEFKDETKWNIIAQDNLPEGKTRDIVIFKSCFPASGIESDEMLVEYKTNYKKLFEIFATHPKMLFVPMSTPPLLQTNTTAEVAKRAQDFENWLIADYLTDYEKYLKNNLTLNTKDYSIGGFKIPRGIFSFPKNKKMSDAIAQASKTSSNLAPFQLHSLLDDENGYLASTYQASSTDDHPNNESGKVVGEAMWKHLNKAIVETGMVK